LALSNLEHLNLSHTRISEIKGLDSLSRLNSVDLSYCPINEIQAS